MENKEMEVLDLKTKEITTMNGSKIDVLTQNETPSPKKSPKISIKRVLVVIVCILIALILIVLGCYITYISNSKQIIGSAIDNITGTLNSVLKTDEELDMKDTFTLNSNIKLNIKSNDTTQSNILTTNDQNSLNYNKLLQNISNTDNTFIYAQDKKKKQLYMNWITNYNNQELINTKYLIDDSTQYYYIKGFLDKYINNGSNNYFESLDEETSTKDNLSYIYEVAIKSLKDNLKDDYFEKYQEMTSIASKEEKLTKVSIKLNNDRLRKIASGILKDLKKDEKAKEILTNIDNDFPKKKIKDTVNFLGKDETIIFSVYTTNLLYKIKKYELVYQNNTEETKITYEQEEKQDQGTVYIIENNKATYELKVVKTNDKYRINIIDVNTNKQLGKVTFEKNKKRLSFIIDYSNDSNQLSVDYDLRISNLIPNKSYDSTMKLSFKIIENNVNVLNGIITATNKVTNKVNISEDTKTSVLESSITEEQREILNQKQENILLQLMR